MTSSKVAWRSRVDKNPIRFGSVKSCAGGVPAITSSLSHAWREMGVFRSVGVLARLNQKDGFDCPGCAWPDPDGKRAMTEFCENGVKAVAEEATVARLTPEVLSSRSLAEWSQLSDFELGKLGRITQPMWLPPGESHYQEIGWEKALDRLASSLKSCATPDEAVFYTSGRTSNEAAFLYQLFVRNFGTNNLPDCSNMCHESSGYALKEAIGVGKGTVTLADFGRCDCILILGQNPGTNHPRMLTSLQEARRNGAKIIAINPLKEAGLIAFKHPQYPQEWIGSGTDLATRYLQIQINGDVALLKGLQKALFDLENDHPGSVIDQQFIDEACSGYDEFQKGVEETSWQEIEEGSGVSRVEIEETAKDVANSNALIACWAMGLTQHENAVGNIQEVTNLLLMRGQIGKPGAGVCPVRGHSNVQGDRTMGIWEKPSDAFLQSLEKNFRFSPPTDHGYDVVNAIRAMMKDRVKVFLCMGGNFLSATPDTEATAEALAKCDLTVQISTKLNRSHLVVGKEAMIFPCLGRTDRDIQDGVAQFVTVEDSMGVVRKSEGRLKPPSPQLKSEVEIVCGVAERVLQPSTYLPWTKWSSDYNAIRSVIATTIHGFENFNQRIEDPQGFYLPNPVRDGRIFNTSTGKARFLSHSVPKRKLAENEWMLMTVRSHDQYNTTIYGLQDRYRGIAEGRYLVFMNQDDMKEQGLQRNQLIRLTSHYDRERVAEGFRVVPIELPRRCLAGYFPELNVLVPLDLTAKGSNTPVSKSVVVQIEAS